MSSPRPGPRVVDPGTGGLAIGAGVVLMIASVLPWISVPGFGGGSTINGLSTDGQETIVAGIVVVAVGALAKARQGRLWVPIVGVVFAAIGVFSVGYRVVEVLMHRSDGSEESFSVGIWLAALAALACLAAAIRCLRSVGPADEHR